MTSTGDPLVGHLLDGRYEITGRLARGGMATVYRALDIRLTRNVAVKVMHVGLGDDDEFARKFDHEARAVARLSHPNVVSVFDQGRDNGRPYIVMEYVVGHTLRDVLSREAPLTPLRALEMIEPVLSALGSAHDAGMVHRDVKPENVLISERGHIKVADFGLAKAISAQTSTATQGLLIGTVSYLPPELVVSGKADARSDVYSAGVVLFEMLTGRKPHTGETPIQVAYAHVHKDVPPPSSLPTAGYIPPYLDALVARVTARDSDLRPPDAKVMLQQVRRVRSALRDGVVDDPELTQDLTVALPRPTLEGVNPSSDPADYEATQRVRPPAPDLVQAPPPAVPFRHSGAHRLDSSTGQLQPRAQQPSAWLGSQPSAQPAPRSSAQPATRSSAQPAVQSSRQQSDHGQRRVARSRWRRWLVLLLVLLMTATALTGWYLVDGRFTSAPALVALPQSRASQEAEAAGLEVSFQSAYSESVAKGTVIATDPDPGAKIRDGGTIVAVVSRGPERYPMPVVVGLSQPAAEAALMESTLAVGSITPRYSETVPAGTVVSASVPVGSSLKKKTAVDLVVSRGPKPIPVTNWSGKPTTAAVAALRKDGFTVTVAREHSASVPAGRVISQSPDSGTGVAKDTIALTSSRGPVMVTVPMVKAMGVRAATDVMRRAGFTVRTARVSQNYLGVGYVAYSDPAARSKAPKGSTITLYLV